jgi:hypothetical protein
MSVSEFAKISWQLIFADEPKGIAELEAELEAPRAEIVDWLIEETCWSDDLPSFVGHKGTSLERLAALRDAYRRMNGNHP